MKNMLTKPMLLLLLLMVFFATASLAEAAVTPEAAKAAALAHANLQEDAVEFLLIQLDFDNGRLEYEVEFYSGNIEYDYDIDAQTGEILSFDQEAENHAPFTIAKEGVPTFIGEEKAWEIVLAHAKIEKDATQFLRFKLDRDDGRYEYELEFISGTTEYDYEIDAVSGEILSFDNETERKLPTSLATGDAITKERAIEIALNHAGFEKKAVTRLKAEYDRDDGRYEYEVEFNVGQIEYSYEIDAHTEKILSYEAEKDD
jgi:Predicted membrane protein